MVSRPLQAPTTSIRCDVQVKFCGLSPWDCMKLPALQQSRTRRIPDVAFMITSSMTLHLSSCPLHHSRSQVEELVMHDRVLLPLVGTQRKPIFTRSMATIVDHDESSVRGVLAVFPHEMFCFLSDPILRVVCRDSKSNDFVEEAVLAPLSELAKLSLAFQIGGLPTYVKPYNSMVHILMFKRISRSTIE